MDLAFVSALYLKNAIPQRVRARSLVNALVVRAALGLTPAPEVVIRALNFRYLVHKLKRQGQNRPVDQVIRARFLKMGLERRNIPVEAYLDMRRRVKSSGS